MGAPTCIMMGCGGIAPGLDRLRRGAGTWPLQDILVLRVVCTRSKQASFHFSRLPALRIAHTDAVLIALLSHSTRSPPSTTSHVLYAVHHTILLVTTRVSSELEPMLLLQPALRFRLAPAW